MIKFLILPLLMFPYVNSAIENPYTNWYSQDRQRIQNFDFNRDYGDVPFDMDAYYELSSSLEHVYYINGGVTFPNSIRTSYKTNVSYYLSTQPLWSQYEGGYHPNHWEYTAGQPLKYYITILFSTMNSVYETPYLNSYIRLILYHPNSTDKFYPLARDSYDYVNVIGRIEFNSSDNTHYLSFNIDFVDYQNVTYTAVTDPLDFQDITNHKFLNSYGLSNFSLNTLTLSNVSENDFNLFYDTHYNPKDLYDIAYNNGYDDGFTNKGLDNWLVSLFGGMGALLNIQILPNLTIGSIIMIFLAIPLTYAIIKLMKGGGD